MINRQPVSSSRIASMGWEASTLEVEFTSGAIYQYTPVDEALYMDVRDNESVGKAFDECIKKDTSITCTKISARK